MNSVRLHVVIPFHQPISAENDVIESAVVTCYEPVLTALEKARNVRVAVHFGGHLLDYLSRRREDFLLRVKKLAQADRIEVLGGLFYGALPALLPELDVRGQVQMTGEYWESSTGRTPQGFWLPEFAWCAELPRMLAETGLEFGFASGGQVVPSRAFGLSIIERGGCRLGAYVVNDALSRALPSSAIDEWVDAAIDQAAPGGGQALTVCVRAEALGLEPGSHERCFEEGWLDSWLAAVSGGRKEMTTVLPTASFLADRPASTVKLATRCAAVAEVGERDGVALDWPDFAAHFPEVDGLHRRMLRASDKLREAIATMQDEGLEDDWSSHLATAQRLIFSAQAPEAYWRGRVTGFTDPEVRDAASSRLAEAEETLDNLVQGEEDWISAEDEDRDGDLVDEVFVSTRHLSAWIVPAEGGRVRTLDDRSRGRSVLDVLTRRGVRDLVLDGAVSAAQLFSGEAKDLATGARWDRISSGIDEAGDLTYRLHTRLDAQLAGATPRQLKLDKTVHVPIDRPEVKVDYKAQAGGKEPIVLGMEIPIRLGTGAVTLTVNGRPAKVEAREHRAVESLQVTSEDGSVVELTLAPAADVWTEAIATSVSDTSGSRTVAQGLVLVPILRVDGAAEGSVTVRVVPAEADEPQEESADAEE